MVEVDVCIGRPKNAGQLFACNRFAGLFQQETQKSERLFLELDFAAAFPKLTAVYIQLEKSKAYEMWTNWDSGTSVGRVYQKNTLFPVFDREMISSDRCFVLSN